MLTLRLSQFDQIKARKSFLWGKGITITVWSNPPVLKITTLVVNRKWVALLKHSAFPDCSKTRVSFGWRELYVCSCNLQRRLD